MVLGRADLELIDGSGESRPDSMVTRGTMETLFYSFSCRNRSTGRRMKKCIQSVLSEQHTCDLFLQTTIDGYDSDQNIRIAAGSYGVVGT